MAPADLEGRVAEGYMNLYDDSGALVKFRKRKWDNHLDFFLTCVSMTVGLGNFWRFPFLCYKNGGGVFFIMYLILLVFIGRPLMYLDMAMGQFSGKGSIHMFNTLSQAWIGIGIMENTCCLWAFSYYAYILSIGMFYCLQSFSVDLPWDKCMPEWGPTCVSGWQSHKKVDNITYTSSAEFYLKKYVQRTNDDLSNGLGEPDWRIIVCLFFTWEMVFLNCMVGIKTTAKASYFLASFPFIIITTLLIRALTLPGAWDGIQYLIKPNWNKFFEVEVWVDATTQVYFSLNVGFSFCANAASYNKIHEKINRAAFLVVIIDTAASVLASFTIFASLGNFADRMKVDMKHVIKGAGMTMVFVTYADCIAKFETIPYIFAIVFFVMFYTLGMGCLVAYAHVYTTNLMELVPKFKEWHAALIVSLLGFFVGIIYTTPGGQVILNLVDLYGTMYSMSIIAVVQVVCVCFSYGLMNWCWDMEFMTGKNTSFFWRWSWAIVAPVMTSFNLAASFIYSENFSPLLIKIGNVMFIITVLPLPLGVFGSLYRNRKLGFKKAWKMAYSSKRWQPFTDHDIEEYRKFRADKMDAFKYADASPVRKFFYALVNKY